VPAAQKVRRCRLHGKEDGQRVLRLQQEVTAIVDGPFKPGRNHMIKERSKDDGIQEPSV
jgi:hypothetical protein